MYAPDAPKHEAGEPGSSPGWHGPAPPRPASATQMSPFLATEIPRGLSSPLATTFQLPVPLCACALGTATTAAMAASARMFLLRISPPRD